MKSTKREAFHLSLFNRVQQNSGSVAAATAAVAALTSLSHDYSMIQQRRYYFNKSERRTIQPNQETISTLRYRAPSLLMMHSLCTPLSYNDQHMLTSYYITSPPTQNQNQNQAKLPSKRRSRTRKQHGAPYLHLVANQSIALEAIESLVL